jgi:8-oxo-dGTP pyrophosphatase MutT (NUDIX family)
MSRKSTDKTDRKRRQYAALAFAEQTGERMVMLVTSRETGRWVLPKGWAEMGLTGPELAAKEAFEEAGLIGEMSARRIGSYAYLKQMPKGRTVNCEVDVFAMRVDQLLDDWPERGQRKREWFTLGQAAMLVDEGDLVTLLLQLDAARG